MLAHIGGGHGSLHKGRAKWRHRRISTLFEQVGMYIIY